MWNLPAFIHAVTAEAAADLVIDAAFAHAGQRGQCHLAQGRVVAAQEEGEVGRMGKLRRAAKAAMRRVESPGQGLRGGRQRLRVEGLGAGCRDRYRAGQDAAQFAILGFDVAAAVAEGFRHLFAEIGKAGQAVARFFREIGAAEERRAIRREKQGQRPAAAALGQYLMRGLVNLVEVGTFLAVDLDIDEQPVHHRRDAFILEGFVGHDMAPVAGRIAYGKQDRPVLPTGKSERLLIPGLPVHRVVGVLQQIGGGFGGEPVG